MDMGSALLSAETAIDFLSEDQKNRVLLCEAPLVEGAVAAAVCSEGGGTLEDVYREARGALQVKREQLTGDRNDGLQQTSTPLSDTQVTADSVEITVTVVNPLGIHARPAATLVSTASRFKSTIFMHNAIGVRKGDDLTPGDAESRISGGCGALSGLIDTGYRISADNTGGIV